MSGKSKIERSTMKYENNTREIIIHEQSLAGGKDYFSY